MICLQKKKEKNPFEARAIQIVKMKVFACVWPKYEMELTSVARINYVASKRTQQIWKKVIRHGRQKCVKKCELLSAGMRFILPLLLLFAIFHLVRINVALNKPTC